MTTDTSKYKLNHSNIRVKDPKRSIKFYEHLGMKQINKIEMAEAKFDLYFMGYDSPKAVSHGNSWTDREGVLLTAETRTSPRRLLTLAKSRPCGDDA